MNDNFERSLSKVLVHEGGYSNHPKDPGGATNRGVTQRVYDAFRRGSKLAIRSVREITDAEVRTIYRSQYWNKVDGDSLPVGLDYVVFDGAANSGPSQSIKWLQRSLAPYYSGQVDGIMGTMTHEAINAYRDMDKLIAAICQRRMQFLQALKTWKAFGKGWSARVAGVRSVGQAWAHGSVGPEVHFTPSGARKGRLSDAKTIPGTGAADGATGIGLGSAGAGAAVSEARDTLSQYADGSQLVQKIVIGLVILGAVLAVGGAVIRVVNKRRAEKLADALDLGAPA